MVVTLWFSKKARRVVKTEIDLSTQGEVSERFNPNFLSRFIVMVGSSISTLFDILNSMILKILIFNY